MSTQSSSMSSALPKIETQAWALLGLGTAVASIAGVLVTQVILISLMPPIALFKPLDSYPRSALFVFVPVVAATILFAWLVNHRAQPQRDFLIIAGVTLVLSFIPDYVLPDTQRTFVASTAAAFLHVVAASITVPCLLLGYQRFLLKK